MFFVQVFHTRNKQGVVIHPTSIFASNLDLLHISHYESGKFGTPMPQVRSGKFGISSLRRLSETCSLTKALSNRYSDEISQHSLSPSSLSFSPLSVGAEKGESNEHQLLAFVTLLETNKPYVSNCVRVPALQVREMTSGHQQVM